METRVFAAPSSSLQPLFMSQQTSNVDDLLARLGLSKKPSSSIAVPATDNPPAPASPLARAPAVARSNGGVSTSVEEGSASVEVRRRESEVRLAETLQRLKRGPAEVRSAGLVQPYVPVSVAAHNPSVTSVESSNLVLDVLPRPRGAGAFWPRAPRLLTESGITDSEIIAIVLKFLIHRGTESGSRIGLHVGLRYPVIEPVMRQLKADKLVIYKSSLHGGDYQYELTDLGRDRARQLNDMCTYYGTAPVPLAQYIASVKAQTITGLKPPLAAIRNALGDLNINPALLSNVGQAIHSGRGMFLFGPPGNGKTSIAERITKSFGDTIWIPKCISASGEIIRLFDPNRHKPVPVEDAEIQAEVDGRWVHIERPTIIAGGELRMENLEITIIRDTGIGEAPLQLKANCGTLLIDDFGRQTMPVDQLLNRWIIPLEQRHDFLQLESGRSIQVPFDELIIFSTNLEPKKLADDAFLRRIPYKIEVKDPSEDEFSSLLLSLAKKLGFQCEPSVVNHLIRVHYLPVKRPFRFCQPRDLLRQVENLCTLHNLPFVVTIDAIDQAVGNYFSIM